MMHSFRSLLMIIVVSTAVVPSAVMAMMESCPPGKGASPKPSPKTPPKPPIENPGLPKGWPSGFPGIPGHPGVPRPSESSENRGHFLRSAAELPAANPSETIASYVKRLQKDAPALLSKAEDYWKKSKIAYTGNAPPGVFKQLIFHDPDGKTSAFPFEQIQAKNYGATIDLDPETARQTIELLNSATNFRVSGDDFLLKSSSETFETALERIVRKPIRSADEFIDMVRSGVSWDFYKRELQIADTVSLIEARSFIDTGHGRIAAEIILAGDKSLPRTSKAEAISLLRSARRSEMDASLVRIFLRIATTNARVASVIFEASRHRKIESEPLIAAFGRELERHGLDLRKIDSVCL